MSDLLLDAAKTATLLLAIVDPFGNVPLLLSMTPDNTHAERRRMVGRACLTAFVILFFFTLFGKAILTFFNLEVAAFQVAGGIILVVVALPMLNATTIGARLLPSEEMEGAEKPDISIVPLAVPLLAGPGAITSVIVLGQGSDRAVSLWVIVSCVALVLAITYIVLSAAGHIARILGTTALNVLTRVMGLITMVIAVQFVLEGIKVFLNIR